MNNSTKSIIAALASDLIALIVSFGVHLSTVQQSSLLSVVVVGTGAAATLYTWLETHKVRAATAVKVATVAATPPSPPAAA